MHGDELAEVPEQVAETRPLVLRRQRSQRSFGREQR